MIATRSFLGAVATLGVLASATLGWASATPATTPGGAPQSRSLLDGVYSDEQAERGLEVYERACVECHRPEEYEGFLRRWEGLPVSFFYQIVASTMPQDNPGGLSRDEYTDVLTYIFSINDVPAGDEELESDSETLDEITIRVPPESSR